MGSSRAPWMGDRCDDMILVATDEEKWRIDTKLVEKLGVRPTWLTSTREVVGTYVCTPLEAPNSGRQAIAKVYMQFPTIESCFDGDHNEKNPSYWGQADPRGYLDHVRRFDPKTFAPQATTKRSIGNQTELQALSDLTHRECPSTPKYLGDGYFPQPSSGWVPGGYIYWILMEKVPGITLFQIWDPHNMSKELITRIRTGFREAMETLWSCGWAQADYGLRNLIWDESQEKCYIIDAENFVRIPETESTTWDTPGLPGDVGSGDYHYYEWGLCDDELLDRIRSFRRSDSPPNV